MARERPGIANRAILSKLKDARDGESRWKLRHILEAMQVLKTHLNKAGELSLARLPVGAQARVIAVNGTGAIARRLMEMGVVPGAPVRVIKAAPLGDPIEVRVRGYHLALRRTEAQTITVVTSGE